MTDHTNGETLVAEESEEMDENMDTQCGGPIKLEPAVAEGEEAMHTNTDSVPYDDYKLFVGGLSAETTEQILREYFGEYGTLTEVNLKQDQVTQRSRGFAFLVFEEPDAVDKVLNDSPHTICDKVVDAKKAIPHAVHQQMKHKTKKVFVGGVPTDMPEETIREYFQQFGEIEEVALVTEKGKYEKGGEKKRRGFCFVTFIRDDDADKACNSPFHKINESEVEVKRATPREQDVNKKPFGGNPHYMPRGGRGHVIQAHGGGRGGWAPYGGHAGYISYYAGPPGYGGGPYMGGPPYGAYGGYGGYNGGYDPFAAGAAGRRDDVAYSSRYGPMRTNYTHSHHSHIHGHHHPYSR